MKPLLLKAGLAIATSIGGYYFSRIGLQARLLPPGEVDGGNNEGGDVLLQGDSKIGGNDVPSGVDGAEDFVDQVSSPSGKSSGDEDDYLLPEFDALVRGGLEIAVKKLEASGVHEESETNAGEFGSCERMKRKDLSTTDEEMGNVKKLVHGLEEREKELEFQLLELHGWKEEQAIVSELENRLKINSVEAMALSTKIECLKADNAKLEARLSSYLGVEAELDDAKEKIKLLERKMASHLESVSDLHGRISTLQASEEGRRDRDEELKRASTRLEDLEQEAANLRSDKSKLERENLDLGEKLTFALTSASNSEETEAIVEERDRLREQNKELLEQIDELKMNMSGDVEERVYLKWLNACLRYELRDYEQPEGREIARELPKSASLESEEKAKNLIFEYAKSLSNESPLHPDYDSEYGSCSQSSLLSELGDFDDSSDSTKNSRGSRKTKFFGKLKRLISSSDRARKTTYDDGSLGRKSFDSVSSGTTPAGNAPVILSQLLSRDSEAEERRSLEEAKLTEQERCRSDLGSSRGGPRRFVFGTRRSISQNGTRGESKEKEVLKKLAKALMPSQSGRR